MVASNRLESISVLDRSRRKQGRGPAGAAL